jgi:hypothetical protein
VDLDRLIAEELAPVPDNRIDGLSPSPPVSPDRVVNPAVPAASPTGTPVLPPQVATWASVVVALAAVLPLVPGLPPVVTTVCGVLEALGAALGIASPGVRK